ncbi:DNA translocase FtsK [Helicobacter sp. MIT 11-5569]|uniref:DNA translocase FtsK n=1 Tax=Helicobacter sp. MIT 11-5569 TaxID=1548151 RepID=UPI00051FECD8|nr:DNA translocase FtsK [Helicobacter sp. MIT 11-5569]TLD82952.1 DNA translocase FtsK [Helicobacter sp. MIT 11-5569]
MASLENFKRFEKSDFYFKEEEKQEEPIKLIKKEEIHSYQNSQDEQDLQPQQVEQHKLQEPTKKQVIKSYPKNLYAATPFSAYYDKGPVGTRDYLVDVENIQKEYPRKNEKNELPSTIFYYGNKASAYPLSSAEVQEMESQTSNAQENVLEPQNVESQEKQQEIPQSTESSQTTEALETQDAESKNAESKIAPLEQEEPQTLQIKEVAIPQYTTIPDTIPQFGYGYAQYQEPAQSMPSQIVTQPEEIHLFQDSKKAELQTNLKPQEQSTPAEQIPIEKTPVEQISVEQIPEEQTNVAPQSSQPINTEAQNTPPQNEESHNIESQPSAIPQSPQIPAQNIVLQNNVESQTHTLVKTLEENVALMEDLEIAQTPQIIESKDYELPKLEFLQEPKSAHIEIDEGEIDRKINDLLNKMRVFKIEGDIVRTYSGPIVTTFEFRPSPNVKVSRILTLQDDLAMALRAKTIRIQAPIPGKDVVGIEIPNAQVETIYLREILENDLFKHSVSPLTLALGKDIVGNPFVTDLKKLPHLLIAGTTGSGKSVGINAMILSLLYKNPPDKLKLIMVDPKMVEFSIYNDIPHLLTPVITNPKNAIFALDVAVKEMEQRNALISEARVKNIDSYNQKAEIEGFEPFPYIVIIIDELADLMMTGGKEAEASISRLTQMARSSGIHLIVATQRPSVDVVTGLIKANLPSRISYKVGQKIDSKVILDCHGAESLLGNGDMLFAVGGGNVTRLHAPFSTEEEIERIVEFIKAQCPPQYDERFLQKEERSQVQSSGESDDLYEEAKRIMLADGKTSISYIQRRLGIGFNKAANIVEQMEQRGFLSKQNSKGMREIIGE